MDDDEFEVEVEEELAPAFRVRPIDLLVVGLTTARQIVGVFHEALFTSESLLRGHANYQVHQMVFQDEARRQIETLTQEE